MKNQNSGNIKKTLHRFGGGIAILFGLLIVALLFFVFSGIHDENYQYERIIVNEPIDINFNDILLLRDTIYEQMAQYCDGMQLIHVNAVTNQELNETPWKTISLIYYKYIDDSREGGNIGVTEIEIDCTGKKILAVLLFNGAGKAYQPINVNPISDAVLSSFMNLDDHQLKPNTGYKLHATGVIEYTLQNSNKK